MTGVIIFIGAKGARRKTAMVYAKMLRHTCPPHVARMIQCMVLTTVYAVSNRCALYPCDLSGLGAMGGLQFSSRHQPPRRGRGVREGGV